VNAARRKLIQEAIDKMHEAKALLEQACSEEEEYKDNMPENMQSGEKYDTAERACETIQEAVDQLDEIVDGDLTGL
jgi:hypothetical protein